MDFLNIEGLSNELRQKLDHHRPESLARAARIPGMTPAALSILLVHAKALQNKAMQNKAVER
jgi:tRNA uridine 5-carboxymethylaminomethyl modification enzyme